jgi:hypothetical protein
MLMLRLILINVKGPWELARDSNRKVLIASCKEVHFLALAFPFMAEACALRDSLSLAQHLGDNKFIIQSKNSQVIGTVRWGFSAASSASIFDDCRLLASGFREILFKH